MTCCGAQRGGKGSWVAHDWRLQGSLGCCCSLDEARHEPGWQDCGQGGLRSRLSSLRDPSRELQQLRLSLGLWKGRHRPNWIALLRQQPWQRPAAAGRSPLPASLPRRCTQPRASEPPASPEIRSWGPGGRCTVSARCPAMGGWSPSRGRWAPHPTTRHCGRRRACGPIQHCTVVALGPMLGTLINKRQRSAESSGALSTSRPGRRPTENKQLLAREPREVVWVGGEQAGLAPRPLHHCRS